MRPVWILAAVALAVAPAALADTEAGIQAFRHADYAAALKELAAPAKDDDPQALHTLAKIYGAGLGVEKDPAKAAEFLRRAAEGNLPAAQFDFASALVLGEGLEQDVPEALKWFLLAAESDHKAAKKSAGQLAKTMGRLTLIKARIAASKWRREKNRKPDGETPPPN